MCTKHVDKVHTLTITICPGLTTKGIKVKCAASKPRDTKTRILKILSNETVSVSEAGKEENIKRMVNKTRLG